MNLLIFTPTWIDPATRQQAVATECAASIRRQVVDAAIEWRVTVDNPFPIGDKRNILHQYQQARAHFLNGSWNALLLVEHDNVIADNDGVQRMINTPADVVYAPYLLRHGSTILSAWQYIGGRNLGESLTLHPEELQQARAAGTWRICGVGFGCTLIRRHVLEQIEFRGSDEAPDIPFAMDCQRAGFVSLGRFDVEVLHIEDGQVLHPFAVPATVPYLARQSVNALVDSQVMRFKIGETYEMPRRFGADLARAGYLAEVAA